MWIALLLAGPAAAVTRDEVLARAEAWVADAVPYSQSAWYTDPTTGACCYRSDCSGYVSAVWGIDPPGNTTYSFAGGPWDDGASYVIDASELKPGDALNYPGDPDAGTGHVMLYVSGDFWSGYVEVYEEYTTGQPATHRWRSIDPGSYLPIRYVGIEDCTAEVCNGADDDCDGRIDGGSVCAVDDEAAISAWRGDGAGSSDLDGDGRADVCARAAAGLLCALSSGEALPVTASLAALSNAQGFDHVSQYSTLRLADVTGDGRADVCARDDEAGFRCWPWQGATFGDPIQGPPMSDSNGWSDRANYATLRMADIDGDGKADLCGRGDAGFYCWRSTGDTLTTEVVGPPLSDANGWSPEKYWSSIRMADLDGDGRDDVCGRGTAGWYCWISDGAGFPTQVAGPELSDAAGWDQPRFYDTIATPDLDGDGRDDLCARGSAAVYCWISSGAGYGGTITGPPLSDADGWGEHDRYATLRWADVTGDGRDDLCARGGDGVWCWPSTGEGFGERFAGPPLSDSSGWGDYSNYETIELGDLDADGRADLCARADAALYCWRSTGAGFGEMITGPEWSDALGWADPMYFATVRLEGGAGVDVPGETGGAGAGDTGGETGSSGDAAAVRESGGGCGCGGGAAPGGLVVLAGVGLLVRRRAR